MKNKLLLFILILLLPLVKISALTNDDPHKNATCVYPTSNGYSAKMEIYGMVENGLAPSVEITVKKGNTIIYTGEELRNLQVPYSGVEYTLENQINKNLTKADKGDFASGVCPKYLMFYSYTYSQRKWYKLFIGTSKTEQVMVLAANTDTQLKELDKYAKEKFLDKTKKDYDNELSISLSLNGNASSIIGTDADQKKLDAAEDMESAQSKIDSIKAKLKKDPNNPELLAELKEAEQELADSTSQYENQNQAAYNQGTQNTAASKKADKKVSKIRKMNSKLDVNLNITSECGIISADLKSWLKTLLNIINISALVLTVILGMLDFFKAVASGEADANKKAFKKFYTRLIVVGILFLLPVIIEFILGLVPIEGVKTSDPFCLK